MPATLRSRMYGRWSDLVTGYPWLVVSAAVLLAAISGWYSATHFRFQSDRYKLVNEKLPWVKEFTHWIEGFPGSHDFVVVIDSHAEGDRADDPKRRTAEALVDELTATLREAPHVEHVVGGADFGPAAFRLADEVTMKQRLPQMMQSKDLLESPTLADLLDKPVQHLDPSRKPASGAGAGPTTRPTAEQAAAQLHQLTELVNAIDRAIVNPAEPFTLPGSRASTPPTTTQPASAHGPTWRYLNPRGSPLYFVRVTPKRVPEKLDALRPAIDSVRGVVAQARAKHPDADLGITGSDVLKTDETETAMHDGTVTSAVAVVLLAFLLIAAFRSFRLPLLAIVALLLSIAWTLGFTFLVVGHLQVMSAVFAPMLMGLGIEYGIIVGSRYEAIRAEHADDARGFRAAMRDALATTAPGIFTGAITTAVGFGAMMLTDYKGVAELGTIAGGGTVFCLVSMLSVFPALMRIFNPRIRQRTKRGRTSLVPLFRDAWVMPFARHPLPTIITITALTAAASLAVVGLVHQGFDYDLLKLQPTGTESVKWQTVIAQKSPTSIWFGASIVNNLDEARQRVAKFRKLAHVKPEEIGGVGRLIPMDADNVMANLADARATLEPALSQATNQPSESPNASAQAGDAAIGKLHELRSLLAKAVNASNAGLLSVLHIFNGDVQKIPEPIVREMNAVRDAIDRVDADLDRLPPVERIARRAKLENDYTAARSAVARQIDAALSPTIQLTDLPPDIVGPYVAIDGPLKGKMYIEVYPNFRTPDMQALGVDSPLDPRFLSKFIPELESVDPSITGSIVMTYNSSGMILDAYLHAAIAALITVFIIVWLDFRSLVATVLIHAPVVVGFMLTFALMFLLHKPLDIANITALPLMFGIGVDLGVHVLTRFRVDPQTRPLGLSGGIGQGIAVAALANIIGFGSLLIARHHGIWGLGFIMSAGMLLTLLCCWTLLPAALEVWSKGRRHD